MRRFRLAVLISCVIAATPAFAQVDLTGTWQRVGQNDNGNAREPVDLLGMPLSADGRAKALSYDIAALSATERQCQMYPPFYALSGPFPDRKSTRLNSSHLGISYAVFCLKKKKKNIN